MGDSFQTLADVDATQEEARLADWDDLSDTIGVWFESGVGDHQCAGCGRAVGLNDWRWEPPFAFGYFGLTFWNWPPLRQSFVDEVAERLGHRLVAVADKL